MKKTIAILLVAIMALTVVSTAGIGAAKQVVVNRRPKPDITLPRPTKQRDYCPSGCSPLGGVTACYNHMRYFLQKCACKSGRITRIRWVRVRTNTPC